MADNNAATAQQPLPPAPPGCVVVAGMHRSGTSLTASLLATLGVDMGERLVPADRFNSRGYFEDLDLVEFHQRSFARLLPRAAGHADWGWTTQACATAELFAPLRDEAQRLIAKRNSAGRLWGFKDPRTTLLLDFWDPLLPAPVYVAVYRSPALVADSMQRLGAEVFLAHPEYAWSLWRLYNQRLLDFVRRHRNRCLLLNVEALGPRLAQFPGLLHDRLNLPLSTSDLQAQFARELLQAPDDLQHVDSLSRVAWPEHYELFDQLEALADLPGERHDLPRSHPAKPAICLERRQVAELSIIIPTHNDAGLAIEALASVERCALGRYELLLLDDGSRDPESVRILDALQGAGLPVLRQPNAGLSAARNALIRQSQGRFILPLDADNRLVPGFIERALQAFDDDPELGVVYGDRQLFGALRHVMRPGDFSLSGMQFQNSIDACAMFRREVWQDVGGFDEELFGFEDWEFWLHAGKRGWRFRYLPGVAFEYRVRPGSLLSQCNTRSGRLRFRQRLLRKHADLFFTSLPPAVRRLAGGPGPQSRPDWTPNLWQSTILQLYWHTAWGLPRPFKGPSDPPHPSTVSQQTPAPE